MDEQHPGKDEQEPQAEQEQAAEAEAKPAEVSDEQLEQVSGGKKRVEAYLP